MSCFELETVYFAINSTFHVVRNTTGKCDDTVSCNRAYCEVNARHGVDWICFSASQANEIVNPMDPMQLFLYCALAVLTLYSVLMTILFWRSRYQRVTTDDPERLPLL